MSNNYGAPVSFNHSPALYCPRTKLDLSHRVDTASNAGFLCPLGEPIEVVPGDTFSIDIAHLTRMTPTINVPMDNIFLDLYAFYVPNRIVWEHWTQFISGENPTSSWVPNATYTIPMIKLNTSSSANYIKPDTILSYMGMPSVLYCGTINTQAFANDSYVNALPVRGYCKIWSEFFRDQFLQNPLLVPLTDNDVNFSTSTAYQTSAVTGGALCPVCKLPDLFTTCKPEPQYGDSVRIPSAAVITSPTLNDKTNFSTTTPVKMSAYVSGAWSDVPTYNLALSNGDMKMTSGSGTSQTGVLAFSNLVTYGPTIRELQIANLMQIYLEKQLRGGVRYREWIYSMFNISVSDKTVQIPEYLGGKTFKINVAPVVQTSETNNTPQGHVSGYTSSSGSASIFTKSFEEHGFIHLLFCVRYQHTYSQGISKMWRKKSAIEFYNPIFANIGYQPVMTTEIYSGELADAASSTPAVSVDVKQVFGYQEAWYEYRYKASRCTGLLRLNNFTDRLGDSWSMGDIYSTVPTLSTTWIQEDMNNLNRVLAVQGTSTVPQFIHDFFIKCHAVRRMPLYSVPNCLGDRY